MMNELLVSAALAALGAALGPAPQAPPGAWSPLSPLRPLDQGVEDVNPLSASLRELQIDLRQPTGFGQVYHVPGRDDLLMRASGGLFAVFPSSAYANTQRGPLPLIPANTIFYVGEPPALTPPPPPHPSEIDRRVRAPMIVDGRLVVEGEALESLGDARRSERVPAQPPDPATVVGPTFVNDDGYRSQRIAALMERAAAAARGEP